MSVTSGTVIRVVCQTSNLGPWDLGQRTEIQSINTNHHTVGHGCSSCKYKIAHLCNGLYLKSRKHSETHAAVEVTARDKEFIKKSAVESWLLVRGGGVFSADCPHVERTFDSSAKEPILNRLSGCQI